MTRRALIVLAVTGMVVIIAGTIFFIRSRQTPPPTQTETQPQDLVTVSRPSELSDWQLIDHIPFHLTITAPSAWQITVFDNPQGGKGSFRADYLGEGVSASLFVNRYRTSDTPPATIIEGNRAVNYKNIDRNGVPGVSYETRETKGDQPEGDFIENSYIRVNKYLLGDETVETSCHLLGVNYRTLIPTCAEIVESLQFIQ
ncbi:MAG: hypothetical protein HYW00_00050 [Candidatus Colwellbacteria bacterium]|nr:hypothetical protein [Candidatus Colwellbacteria bacterium]